MSKKVKAEQEKRMTGDQFWMELNGAMSRVRKLNRGDVPLTKPRWLHLLTVELGLDDIPF